MSSLMHEIYELVVTVIEKDYWDKKVKRYIYRKEPFAKVKLLGFLTLEVLNYNLQLLFNILKVMT